MSDKGSYILIEGKEELEETIREIANKYRQLKEPLNDNDRELKTELHRIYLTLMEDYYNYFIKKKRQRIFNRRLKDENNVKE